MSLVAMRMAEREGYWLVLLVSFIALPIRGVIAAWLLSRWGVYPVQILDGAGAGLQSVCCTQHHCAYTRRHRANQRWSAPS